MREVLIPKGVVENALGPFSVLDSMDRRPEAEKRREQLGPEWSGRTFDGLS